MPPVRDKLGLFDLVPLGIAEIRGKLAGHTSGEVEEFAVEMFDCEATLPDPSQRRALTACRRVLDTRGEPERFQAAWEKFLADGGVPADKAAGQPLPAWVEQLEGAVA